ncbi:MAG: hypothetical protein ACK53Y_01190, partial [bacterium]
ILQCHFSPEHFFFGIYGQSQTFTEESCLFPKVCDHEQTAEIGWLLYSARQQDEERVSAMISSLVNETIGAKWRPIRTNDRQRAALTNPQERTYALHLEGS